MSYKFDAGFKAALALSAALTAVPSADATVAVNVAASSAAVATASSAAAVATVAAAARRQREYNNAVSSVIVNPDTQNIRQAVQKGLAERYAPYAVQCQSRVNEGKANQVSDVTSSMIKSFEGCVHDQNILSQATASGERAAKVEGMSESDVLFLAKCQNSNGITAGSKDGVSIAQAWNTVKCAENAAGRAWNQKYLPILGGLAGAGTLIAFAYAFVRCGRELD